MATVTDVKNKMLDKLAAMDLDGLTLMDANMYVDVLSKLAAINEKPYAEMLADAMTRSLNGGCNAGYALAQLGDSGRKE